MASPVDAGNFQRVGSISNAHVGRDFERTVAALFRNRGYPVVANFPVRVGHGDRTKVRRFDLGCADPEILIECKSHRWTTGGNSPSAKMTVWNEAMYYFHLAPVSYKKWLCVLADRHVTSGQSLAQHYLRSYDHLVPDGVEILEFDLSNSEEAIVYRSAGQERF